MLLHGTQPLARRSLSSIPLAIALSIGVAPYAVAQSQSQHEFASSTEGMTGELSSFEAPAAPSPAALNPAAAGGEQSERSYGYHDHSWSSHLTFEAGGGGNAPIGNDQPFVTWGGNFTVGGGYRFNRHLSALLEYQFMDNKIPGALASAAGSDGGHVHIWSLTADPVIDLFPSKKYDAYVTGGGGFYRKVTSFTDVEEVEECYYFCIVGDENVTVGHFSSNQGGANFGIGITRKLGSADTGGDDRLKVFLEARYLWLDTPKYVQGTEVGGTELIPITLGLRW